MMEPSADDDKVPYNQIICMLYITKKNMYFTYCTEENVGGKKLWQIWRITGSNSPKFFFANFQLKKKLILCHVVENESWYLLLAALLVFTDIHAGFTWPSDTSESCNEAIARASVKVIWAKMQRLTHVHN